MLVIEGTYENGEVHLDSPVSYSQPVRVRVEFLDDLSAAVQQPAISDQAERAQRLQASWAETHARPLPISGTPLSEEVLTARALNPY